MRSTPAFPLPWTVHHNEDAYWLEDSRGKQFGFTYFRDDLAGVSGQAYHSRDAARRVTTFLAGAPERYEQLWSQQADRADEPKVKAVPVVGAAEPGEWTANPFVASLPGSLGPEPTKAPPAEAEGADRLHKPD